MASPGEVKLARAVRRAQKPPQERDLKPSDWPSSTSHDPATHSSDNDGEMRRMPDVIKDDMSARRVSCQKSKVSLSFNQYLLHKSTFIPPKRRVEQEDTPLREDLEGNWSEGAELEKVRHLQRAGIRVLPAAARYSSPHPADPPQATPPDIVLWRDFGEQDEEVEPQKLPDVRRDDLAFRREQMNVRKAGVAHHFLPGACSQRDRERWDAIRLASQRTTQCEPASESEEEEQEEEKVLPVDLRRDDLAQRRSRAAGTRTSLDAFQPLARSSITQSDLETWKRLKIGTESSDSENPDARPQRDLWQPLTCEEETAAKLKGKREEEEKQPNVKKDDMMVRRTGTSLRPLGASFRFLPPPSSIRPSSSVEGDAEREPVITTKRSWIGQSSVAPPSSLIGCQTESWEDCPKEAPARTASGATPIPCSCNGDDDEGHLATRSVRDMQVDEDTSLQLHSQSQHELIHHQEDEEREEDDQWQQDLERWKTRRRNMSQKLIEKEEKRKTMEKLMIGDEVLGQKSIKTYREIVKERAQRESDLHDDYTRAVSVEEKAAVLQRYSLRFTITDSVLEKLQLPKLPSACLATDSPPTAPPSGSSAAPEPFLPLRSLHKSALTGSDPPNHTKPSEQQAQNTETQPDLSDVKPRPSGDTPGDLRDQNAESGRTDQPVALSLTGECDFASESAEQPVLTRRLDHWTWDPNEERHRQERWQRQQEKQLQEQYKREQEKLKEEWERAQREVKEEERRHREEERRILEETVTPLTPHCTSLTEPCSYSPPPSDTVLSLANFDWKQEMLESNGPIHSSDSETIPAQETLKLQLHLNQGRDEAMEETSSLDPHQNLSQSTGTSRTVSGKRLCSSCSDPVEPDAAMIVDTLGLYFHFSCFRCSVCKRLLGNSGSQVQIRTGRLNCLDCSSKSSTAGQPTAL